MDLSYKDTAELGVEINDLLENNISSYRLPSGKLDPLKFPTIYKIFQSNLLSNIRNGLDALIEYAKEQNYDLFIENNMFKINKLMIQTAFHEGVPDFLSKTLRFYKHLTKCDLPHLKMILDTNLIEFFFGVYREPTDFLSESYIFQIFTNVFNTDSSYFHRFINEGYHIKMIDRLWNHFENADSSDDESRVISSNLKFLPIFYLNYDIISNRTPEFFNEWSIAFWNIFGEIDWNNRFVIPALIESLKNCSNTENIPLLCKFYTERYFPIYFNFLLHPEKRVRLNMIGTFMNFIKIDSDELIKIVNAGLFNIELLYNKMDSDEIVALLKLMNNYILKSNQIAEKIAFSKILFDINANGTSLIFNIKEMFFIILAQLIRIRQLSVLHKVFDLCPSYIELSAELLETIKPIHRNIILNSFLDLTSFAQSDRESEFALNIENALLSDQMNETLNQILEIDSSDQILYEKIRSLMSSLKQLYLLNSGCE